MKLWPFSRTASAPEQMSLASPDAALEALFGLTPTAAGIAVTASEALRVPVVSNAIQLISEAVASLDVMVKRIDGTAEVDVPSHPLLGLLRDEQNEWTSGFELVRQIVVDALTSDAGGMVWVNRVGGEARELIRYRSGLLTFDLDTNTGERRYRLNVQQIPSRDVIHLLPPLGRAPLSAGSCPSGFRRSSTNIGSGHSDGG